MGFNARRVATTKALVRQRWLRRPSSACRIKRASSRGRGGDAEVPGAGGAGGAGGGWRRWRGRRGTYEASTVGDGADLARAVDEDAHRARVDDVKVVAVVALAHA